MKKEPKTNVMRLLESQKIPYESRHYEPDPAMTGEQIAGVLGENPDQVFKTLVTEGRSGAHYVFVIPVCKELDLKKAASACGEKSVGMIKQKDLLPLTGYVHGGCSPVGMKKQFPTYIHRSVSGFDRMFVSAGQVGCQICVSPDDLIRVVSAYLADLVV